MKTAIIVLSDPTHGGEESLGRVFNALAATSALRRSGQTCKLLFQGTGSRWPVELSKEEHPLHRLFVEVTAGADLGVSCGCADVFGARSGVEALGFELLTDNAIPGTSGLPDLSRLAAEGWQLVTF